MGTPTPKGAGVEAMLPRMAKKSQKCHGCPRSGHGCPNRMELVLGLHQECPRVVKLVMELHHASQGANKGSFRMVELVCGLHHVSSSGDQRKFLSGGAST